MKPSAPASSATQETQPQATGWFESADLDVRTGPGEPSRFPKSRGGYLRRREARWLPRRDDVVVPPHLCERYGLRGGEEIVGKAAPPSIRGASTALRLESVETINGRSTSEHLRTKFFEDLTPLEPWRQLHTETENGPLSTRVIDLLVPIGFGQRALLVGPPRTGKTILLQQIAHGILANRPDVHLFILLIDERPEEVTEMRRHAVGEVVASAADREARDHVRLANLLLERGKRLVETGQDVVILLDSLTRLGRAYHAVTKAGRALDGDVDTDALVPVRAFFSAGRDMDEGGSLTFLATLLTETGNVTDERISEELRAAGNLEIRLAAELARARTWPAIDLTQSWTPKQDLILTAEAFQAATKLHKEIEGLPPKKAMQTVLDALRRHDTNAELIAAD